MSRAFFSEMVVVRRAQPVEPDLMTPAEQRDVQKSIANAILSAKWAYLHQDAALYRQQLNAALQQSQTFHASGDHHDALQALLTEPVALEWPPLGEALQRVNALQQARQAGDL